MDSEDVEDMSYLHTLHNYMATHWIIGYTNDKKKGTVPIYYESPLNYYLERKKSLLVSLDGGGRKEMEKILSPEINESDDKKSNWDRMTQT